MPLRLILDSQIRHVRSGTALFAIYSERPHWQSVNLQLLLLRVINCNVDTDKSVQIITRLSGWYQKRHKTVNLVYYFYMIQVPKILWPCAMRTSISSPSLTWRTWRSGRSSEVLNRSLLMMVNSTNMKLKGL